MVKHITFKEGWGGQSDQVAQKGRDYWYIVEPRRVDGRPRIVWQHHLGTADAIAGRARQAPGPVVVAEFGALAALWSIVERLDLVGIIDRVVPRRPQGVSLGYYLVLAALNRVVAPQG